MTSTRLQATKRPGIDSVFWDYEALFNKIDAIKETFSLPVYRDKEWIQELHAGVEKMSMKLQEYYDKTGMPYVYSDACILEPFGKLVLFKQERFEEGSATNWVEMYKNDCRSRYVNNYEMKMKQDVNSRKRQHEESFDDEEKMNDYRSFLHQQSREAIATQNEFDRYLVTSSSETKIKTLKY